MRRSVVLHRNWSVLLCLVVAWVPMFCWIFLIFLFPTSCSQRGSSRKDGDLMAQLCNLLEARYQNMLQLWSWDLAVAGGPGPPASNEIADLLLPLLQLLWFTEICCGNGLPKGLACCCRKCCIYKQAPEVGHSDLGAGEDVLSPIFLFPSWQSLVASFQGYANINILAFFFFFPLPTEWGEGCLFSCEIKQHLPSNLLQIFRAQLQQSHIWEE